MILETFNRGYRSSQSNEIKVLTQQIDQSFRETARSVFQIGRCLHRLKELMPHKEFLELVETRWNMSHMSAHRLITTFLTFKQKQSRILLTSKPSVLYIISTLDNPQQIAALAAGKKIEVNGSMKTISQLTVKDAQSIKKKSKAALIRNDANHDKRIAEKLHEEIATAFERLDDLATTIKRLKDQGVQISKKEELKDYLVLTIENLKDVLCLLD